MNSYLQNNYSGSSKISDQSIFEKYDMSPVNMRMDMHMLMGMYGFSNKLSLMVMLNYVYSYMDMKMLAGQMSVVNNMMNMGTMDMTSTSQGFSDTKISVLYNLLSANKHSIIADVGFSVPTGSIAKTEKNDISFYGQTEVYNMQTGSGTFDFLPGITYVYHQPFYQIGAQATSVIHPYYNSQGYKLGNELTVNTWAACEWWQKLSVSFRLNYNVAGQIQGSDSNIPALLEPGADPKNYGGSLLKGFIGAAYFFYDDLFKNSKIAAEFGIPVYENFNGIQTATSYNLILSWVLTF
jgi:hypothetical protein